MSAENASSCDVGDSGDEDNVSFIGGHDDEGEYPHILWHDFSCRKSTWDGLDQHKQTTDWGRQGCGQRTKDSGKAQAEVILTREGSLLEQEKKAQLREIEFGPWCIWRI